MIVERIARGGLKAARARCTLISLLGTAQALPRRFELP